jgi:hypothetical protein
MSAPTSTGPGITYKQAAAHLRKLLNGACGGWRAPGGGITWSDGSKTRIPAGLGFAVRATKNGVNITIEDHGYIDAITGGDRAAWGPGRPEMNDIIELADEVRKKAFSGPDGKLLPGTTGWGPVIISARTTGWTHVGRDGSETKYAICDTCGAEVPWGDRRELAGPGGLKTLCETCNDVEMGWPTMPPWSDLT